VTCFWPVSDLFLTRFWPVSDLFLGRKLVELSRVTHHRSLTSHNITAPRSSRAGSRRTIDITNLECWGAQSAAPATNHEKDWRASRIKSPCAGSSRNYRTHTSHSTHISRHISPHSLTEEVRGPEGRRIITHQTSHITHISPHHTASLSEQIRGLEGRSTRITTRNSFQTLSRASQNTEKYENYHEKWTSKKLKSRKVRELPRTSRWATRSPRFKKNELPKKLKSRKPRELPYKTPQTRSQPPGMYENYREKRTCKRETM